MEDQVEEEPISPVRVEEEQPEEEPEEQPGGAVDLAPPIPLPPQQGETSGRSGGGLNRRQALTPGRQVTFPPSPTTGTGAPVGAASRREVMDMATLQTTLHHVQAQLESTQQEVRTLRRGTIGVSSISMTGETTTESGSRSHKAKLKAPEVFKGAYTVLSNVLNWHFSMENYLENCQVEYVLYSKFARTYMSETVQAWMDAKYHPDNPLWEDLKNAMVLRYLPADHSTQLELKFESLRQLTDIPAYVDLFQIVMAALILGGVEIRMEKKILQFIRGMKLEEEKRFLLQEDPKTLEDAYALALTSHRAKVLTSTLSGRKTGKFPFRPAGESKGEGKGNWTPKQLKKLEGKAREKAFQQGLCLGCGQSGHFIANCPRAKRMLKALELGVGKFGKMGKKETDKKNKKLRAIRALIDSDFESSGSDKEEEEDAEDEAGKEEEAEETSAESGNSDPESEG